MRILATFAAAATIPVALAAALFAPTGCAPRATGPGECPGFTSDDIDEVATAIGLSSLAEADLLGLRCEDDPTVPQIELFAVWVGPTTPFFSFQFRPTGRIHNFVVDYRRRHGSLGGFVRVVSGADAHICRAEVLRSFTWRRLCADNVDRSPN